MQFYVDDWLSDPALSSCSPAARGIWADLVCAMHKLDRGGVIAGTREQLARLGRCSAAELGQALAEIKATNTAEVTERAGRARIVNRRMKREARARQSLRLRVRRHRESREGAAPALPPAKAAFKLPQAARLIAGRFEAALGIQWINDAGKWVNRCKALPSKSERVVAEVESAIKEGRIRATPAQYAEQIWKEFQQ
jgi:hypothetical protein